MKWDNLLTKECFNKAAAGSIGVYKNDYDTIICSTLFRRLQDKAQVFPLEEDDYVRTRLTHSLEVSAIGKKLGEFVFKELRKEQKDIWFESHSEKDFADVLLCAGLIHDIGNPPFGHFGEYAIREWFQTYLKDLTFQGKKIIDILSIWQIQDLYNFEGNAQSMRVLSKTPYLGKMEGFNLSYSVLAAMMKYPISSLKIKGSNPKKYKKIGYNFSEKELFLEIDKKTGMNGSRHPLSYLLEAADDIAYRASDLEDAMVKKVINFSQIIEALRSFIKTIPDNGDRKQAICQFIHMLSKIYDEELENKHRKPELTAIQRWNQYMQEIMMQDVVNTFIENYDVIMQGEYEGDLFTGTLSGYIISAISKLSEDLIYTSSMKIKTELFGRRIIDSLLSQFMEAAIKYDTKEEMTYIDCRIMDIISGFYKSMYHAESKGKSEEDKLYLRILMVTDYISGMTDNYAKRLYKELFA